MLARLEELGPVGGGARQRGAARLDEFRTAAVDDLGDRDPVVLVAQLVLGHLQEVTQLGRGRRPVEELADGISQDLALPALVDAGQLDAVVRGLGEVPARLQEGDAVGGGALEGLLAGLPHRRAAGADQLEDLDAVVDVAQLVLGHLVEVTQLLQRRAVVEDVVDAFREAGTGLVGEADDRHPVVVETDLVLVDLDERAHGLRAVGDCLPAGFLHVLAGHRVSDDREDGLAVLFGLVGHRLVRCGLVRRGRSRLVAGGRGVRARGERR